MFGLPIFVIALLAVAIVALIAIGGFYAYRRHQVRFQRFFEIDPETGSEESVKGVIRQVLRRMSWDRGKLEAQLDFDNQWAAQAIDTEASLQVHHDADQTRKQLLQQNTDIGNAVAAASHFGHSDVVRELNLQQHMSDQGS